MTIEPREPGGGGAPALPPPPAAARAMGVPWPIWASLGGNLVLFFAKLGCFLATGSLAVAASLAGLVPPRVFASVLVVHRSPPLRRRRRPVELDCPRRRLRRRGRLSVSMGSSLVVIPVRYPLRRTTSLATSSSRCGLVPETKAQAAAREAREAAAGGARRGGRGRLRPVAILRGRAANVNSAP